MPGRHSTVQALQWPVAYLHSWHTGTLYLLDSCVVGAAERTVQHSIVHCQNLLQLVARTQIVLV